MPRTPISRFPLLALLMLVFCLLTAGIAPPAALASGGGGGAMPTPAAPEKAADAPELPSKAEINQAIKLLENDDARDKLVNQLKVLSTAAHVANGDNERTTVGARVVMEIRESMATVGKSWSALLSIVDSWPAITQWIEKQIDTPASRERWAYFIAELVMVLAAGFTARWLAITALRRPRNALERATPATALGKLPFLIGRTALDTLPVGLLAVAAYGVLALTDPAEKVRLAALPIINATIAIEALVLLGAFAVSPTAPALRLLAIGDDGATRALSHLRTLGRIGFYGWFMMDSAFVLGLPKPAYALALKMVGALVALLLIHRLFSYRRAVARLIRGDDERGEIALAGTDVFQSIAGTNRFSVIRRRFADIWHVIAAAYVGFVCVVWLLEIKGGFTFLARATAITAVTLLLAQAVAAALQRGLSRPVQLSHGVNTHLPSLERRLDSYRPWVRRVTTALVWVSAAVVVLDAWGAGTLNWLVSNTGQRILGSVITIGLALIFSVVAWEVVSLSIERALLPAGREGNKVERSSRIRTLLPLLRNAFLVLLVVFVGLFSLAELGVNIAPLLAGAGVVGLAIGFGSQTLVKDVITGLFILIEDTIAVGDVVDVGGGHSGVVEAISIRTIRLRDVTGAVHTVPFSAVTTVRNMTKDFSFAVFDVQVDYREDTDRVVDVLIELGNALAKEEPYAADIIAPFEVLGVDRLADSAVVIKARFKTRPMRQWAIAREFNRRMKKRFDELGIGIPYPHMHLIMERPATSTPALPAAQG